MAKKTTKKTGKTGRRTATAAQKTALKREAARRKDIRNAKALESARKRGVPVRHPGRAGSSPMKKSERGVDARTTSRVKGKDGLHDKRFIRDDGTENTFKEKQDMKKRDAARKKARYTEKTAKQKKAGSTERTAAQKKVKKRPTNKHKRRYGSV